MYEEFPQENYDDDLGELDGTMREESYDDEEDVDDLPEDEANQ